MSSSSLPARPFFLLGASAAQAIEQKLFAALRPWADCWLPEGPREFSLEIKQLDVDVRAADFQCVIGTHGRMWCRDTVGLRGALTRTSLGENAVDIRGSAADDWLADLSGQIWALRNDALRKSMIGEMRPSHGRLSDDTDLQRSGSSAVIVRSVSIGLEVAFDDQVLHHVPPISRERAPLLPTLVPLIRAAGSVALPLDLVLGTAEVELAALLALQPGDVLRFPAPFGSPLDLRCGDRSIATALLGRQDDRKCIQIEPLKP